VATAEKSTIKGYELAGEWNALDELLEETGGEVTPEIEALMNALDVTTTEKVEKIALVVLRKKSEAKAIKEQADRLAARAKARENAATHLVDYLSRVMQSVGKDKIEGTLATVAFQKNPPSVVADLSRDRLEDLYETGCSLVLLTPATHTLDKKAVLAAAKAGQPLPGGIEIVQTSSLRIR
jgi:hypothetical protein